MINKSQKYINIASETNTRALSNCDSNKITARAKVMKNISNLICNNKPKMFRVTTSFPTNALAQDAEMSLTEYAKLKGFPDSTGLRYAKKHGTIYKKRYKIYTIEAFESNLNRTSSELLETPEADNQQPSLGSI